MIDPTEQDTLAYENSPTLLAGSFGSQQNPPFISAQQAVPEPARPAAADEYGGSEDFGIDTQTALLEAILQELRSLNQSIQNKLL